MTKEINTAGWKLVGEAGNSKYYAIREDVLGALPNPGTVDDLTSAKVNVAFQNDYFRKRGHGGVVVVFFDNLVSQDKEARRVYQTEPEAHLMRATALVGGTLLGRAMASFFLGLSRPRIPVKMFASVEEALVWAAEINRRAEAAGAAAEPRA